MAARQGSQGTWTVRQINAENCDGATKTKREDHNNAKKQGIEY